MTPSARRAGILAGLVLSLVCALGFAHRSTGEIAEQCRAEAEGREAREAELDAQRAAHEEQMDAMNQRVAALESDLARERGLREAADGRAVEAGRPDAELEAAKAELERAYARIGELERGDAGDTWGGKVRLVDGKQVDALTALREEKRVGVVVTINGAVAEEGTEFVFDAGDEEILCGGDEKAGTRKNSMKVKVKNIWGSREVEPAPTAEPQKFDGGLNQGIDYVDPAEVAEKLERIRGLLTELKEVRREQIDLSTVVE
jgi:multidrug efflux pump subunit AcrA (membrane-fusion protein)